MCISKHRKHLQNRFFIHIYKQCTAYIHVYLLAFFFTAFVSSLPELFKSFHNQLLNSKISTICVNVDALATSS